MLSAVGLHHGLNQWDLTRSPGCFSGDWDVHWGHGVSTHGHLFQGRTFSFFRQEPQSYCPLLIGLSKPPNNQPRNRSDPAQSDQTQANQPHRTHNPTQPNPTQPNRTQPTQAFAGSHLPAVTLQYSTASPTYRILSGSLARRRRRKRKQVKLNPKLAKPGCPSGM